MTKEELIRFLKENLKLDLKEETEMYSQRHTVTVKLMLGDYVLSEDWIELEAGDQQLI